MLRVMAALALSSAALAGSPADAQPFGMFIGRPFVQAYGPGPYGSGWMVQSVCSGQRAEALERRLRHEQGEGEIAPWDATRIHYSIDRLEARQWHECAEGDWPTIARLNREYDEISRWIDIRAHGYRSWNW